KDSPDSLGTAPTTISGLRYLSGAFQSLAQAVDSADVAPSRDAREGYTKDRTLLDHSLAKWGQFKATTLPELNAQLRSAGIEPIAPQAAGAPGRKAARELCRDGAITGSVNYEAKGKAWYALHWIWLPPGTGAKCVCYSPLRIGHIPL